MKDASILGMLDELFDGTSKKGVDGFLKERSTAVTKELFAFSREGKLFKTPESITLGDDGDFRINGEPAEDYIVGSILSFNARGHLCMFDGWESHEDFTGIVFFNPEKGICAQGLRNALIAQKKIAAEKKKED